jgi:hypothetical protein
MDEGHLAGLSLPVGVRFCFGCEGVYRVFSLCTLFLNCFCDTITTLKILSPTPNSGLC